MVKVVALHPRITRTGRDIKRGIALNEDKAMQLDVRNEVNHEVEK